MKRPVDHVLLTRFNLPTGGLERSIRDHHDWLTNRIELFDRYCAPSVRAQSNADFSWIVYFDPESPEWLKQRVREYAASGLFTPIYRVSVSPEDLMADIRNTVRGDGRALLTTNLDNDDALAIDFVDRIQALPELGRRTAVFFTTGLIKSHSGVYFRVDRDNAFCSVVEPWDAPVTCWSDWHILLRQSMPVIGMRGRPAWLQVVHGENVSNRVRGKLIDSRPWQRLFPGAIDDVAPPTPVTLLVDRLVTAPIRAAKDYARSGAKWVALALLGKEGLHRLKLRISSIRK